MDSSQPTPVQASSAPDLTQLIDAVVATISHPDLPTILNDIQVVVGLVHNVNGPLHPSALSLLKSLL